MDWQERNKRTTDAHRTALFELYPRRHDRIDNRDLVDRSAPSVVGRYLVDKPRVALDKLAHSKRWWERRTAIVSTDRFIRLNQLDETFRIVELLVHNEEELVQKAVGGWMREAGRRDGARLTTVLERHAATMPRIMLRFAIEKLPKTQRDHFMSLRAGAASDLGAPSLTRRRPARTRAQDDWAVRRILGIRLTTSCPRSPRCRE